VFENEIEVLRFCAEDGVELDDVWMGKLPEKLDFA